MLVRLVVSLAVLTGCAGAFAQSDYPTKTIRFLLPFAPGGAGDVLARLTGQRLQEKWGAQFVVEPRPGAGGIVATEVCAKAPPDGHTFEIVTVGHAVNPSLYSKLPYDTLNDFTAWINDGEVEPIKARAFHDHVTREANSRSDEIAATVLAVATAAEWPADTEAQR